MNDTFSPAGSEVDTVSVARPMKWRLVFGGLFDPSALCLILAAAGWDGYAIAAGLVGSGVGGLVSGVTLGLWLGKSPSAQAAFSIAFFVLFEVACFVMSAFGCGVGGIRIAG